MRNYILIFALILPGCNGTSNSGLSEMLSAVQSDPQLQDWTLRLSGAQYVLHDVIWDGGGFIAVGDGGVVLTSADGITWTEIDTPTEASLLSVDFYGPDIFAVGRNATVLKSSDHGASWTIELDGQPYNVLQAVVANDSLIVSGGFNGALAADLILISEDGGDSWTSPLPFGGGTGLFFTDLVYTDGLYIAATKNLYTANNCQGDSIGHTNVRVSSDGRVWNTILLRDEPASSNRILHDGTQFIAVGDDSTVFASFDGYNWKEFQLPIQDVDYLSAAWDGSKLVAAGRTNWCHWTDGEANPIERPIGISSTDGGVTWQSFNIDGHYESRALAWGNGRFVSVGQTTPISGEGAIYSTN